ncbi:MAG TPA: hypothetical protein VMY43_10845 [Methanothrix sp.]|nr:hypothetical protein [Methanothrix sp.]
MLACQALLHGGRRPIGPDARESWTGIGSISASAVSSFPILASCRQQRRGSLSAVVAAGVPGSGCAPGRRPWAGPFGAATWSFGRASLPEERSGKGAGGRSGLRTRKSWLG